MTNDKPISIINTPAGKLYLFHNKTGTLQTSWCQPDTVYQSELTTEKIASQKNAETALRDHFDNRIDASFDDIPTPSGTAFQQKVWDACRNIPAGETRSYGELATQAGSPKAARAVGQAMRNNPLAVIIPCHRVIASSGKLHGYSGATDPDDPLTSIKKTLLDFETRE